MECIEIKSLNCPKCKRVLKPSSTSGVLEITEYQNKTVKKLEILDILICRYCNIYVKVEVLRKQKDPIKFLVQFKHLPENNEMKNEELLKINLRQNASYCLKKFKHPYIPEKCLDCNSDDLIADSHDFGWICMSCDSYFQWERFLVMFHGDCEVYARDGEEAIGKGYLALGNKAVDIEADWM